MNGNIQETDWKFHETTSELHVLCDDIRQRWVSLGACTHCISQQQSWLLGSSTSTIRRSFVSCTNSLRSWSRSRMEC